MIYNPTLSLHEYKMPSIALLNEYGGDSMSAEDTEKVITKIVSAFNDFGIELTPDGVSSGSTVTQYEFTLGATTKLSKVKGLEEDISFRLGSQGVRIVAPIEGKAAIGVEVPNENPSIVSLSDVITSDEFKNSIKMALPIAMGETSVGDPFVFDLAKMPHILMAGATGQGKSVGINVMLASLLYSQHPSNVKLVLIDPKKVELTMYNKLGNHFLAKARGIDSTVISDVSQAVNVLESMTEEMDNRLGLLQDASCRNIIEYNTKYSTGNLSGNHRHLPYIVLVIDEFADLIMTAGKDIELPLARLAQLSRAVGMHLVVATQRPSSDVITGLIKANFPARISFRVASKIDSRTVLDSSGADALIGKGDMLFKVGINTTRVQSAFIDTDEIERLVKSIGEQDGFTSPYLLPYKK